MRMQALRSAAHAAGYAMAAEDVAEPRPEPGPRRRESTALAVRTRRHTALRLAAAEVMKARRFLRRLWLRDWLAAHWSGRAPA